MPAEKPRCFGRSYPSRTRERILIYDRSPIPAIEIFEKKSEGEVQAYLTLETPEDGEGTAGMSAKEKEEERDWRLTAALAFAKANAEKMDERHGLKKLIGARLDEELAKIEGELKGPTPVAVRLRELERRKELLTKHREEAKKLEQAGEKKVEPPSSEAKPSLPKKAEGKAKETVDAKKEKIAAMVTGAKDRPSSLGSAKQELTLIEMLKHEWDYHPWRTAITGGALVLGGAFVLRGIARWLRGADGAGRVAASEKKGAIRKFFSYLLGFGVAALGITAAVGIYRTYQKMHGAIDALKGQAEQLGKEAKERTKRLADDAKQEGKVLKDKVQKEITPEREAEMALEGENIAAGLLAPGLIVMHGSLAKGEELIIEGVEEKAVATLLSNPQFRRESTIGELNSVDSMEAAQRFLERKRIIYSPAQTKAAYFLALVCKEDRALVLEALKRRGKEVSEAAMNALTIQDFFESVKQVPTMVSRMATALKGKSIRHLKPSDIQDVFSTAFAPDTLVESISSAPVKSFLESQGIRTEKEIASFLAYCSGEGLSRALKDVSETGQTDGVKKSQRAVMALREALKTSEVQQHLALYFHGREDLPFAPQLHSLTAGTQDISVFDAVQLYSCLLLASGTGDLQKLPRRDLTDAHPVGALLLQMKVIDLLAQQDKDLGSRMQAYLFLQASREAAGASSELQIPEGMRHALAKMATTLGATLKDATVSFAQEQLNRFQAWHAEYWREYWPIMAPGEAAVGGFLAYRYPYRRVIRPVYRWARTDWPTTVSNRLIDAAAGRGRTGSGPEWGKGPLTTLGTDVMKVRDTIDMLDPVHAKQLRKAYRGLIRQSYTEKAFNRFYGEVARVRAAGGNSAVLDDVLSRVSGMANDPKKLQVLRVTRNNYWMRHFKGASTFGRALHVAGLAAQAYAIYSDVVEIGDSTDAEREAAQYAKALFADLREDLEESRMFKEGPAGTFVHLGTGVRVSLREVRDALRGSGQHLSDKTQYDYGRFAVDMTGGVLWAATAFSGPWGLAIAGVQVAVHTAINVKEEVKVRQFLKDCPPWLLCVIGMRHSTETTEHDFIASASNFMGSDLLRGGDMANETEKRLLRKKAFVVLFFQEMQRSFPDLAQEILQGDTLVTFFADNSPFFKHDGDYDRIVGRYLAVRLFQMSRDPMVKWKNFRDHKIDEGWLDLENVSQQQMRQAVRESVVLYAQHLREKRFRSIQDCSPDASEEERLYHEAFREDLESQYVLGRKLGDTPSLEDGRTHVQEYLDRMHGMLENASAVVERQGGTATRKTVQVGSVPIALRDGDLPSLRQRTPDLNNFLRSVIDAEEERTWHDLYGQVKDITEETEDRREKEQTIEQALRGAFEVRLASTVSLALDTAQQHNEDLPFGQALLEPRRVRDPRRVEQQLRLNLDGWDRYWEQEEGGTRNSEGKKRTFFRSEGDIDREVRGLMFVTGLRKLDLPRLQVALAPELAVDIPDPEQRFVELCRQSMGRLRMGVQASSHPQ